MQEVFVLFFVFLCVWPFSALLHNAVKRDRKAEGGREGGGGERGRRKGKTCGKGPRVRLKSGRSPCSSRCKRPLGENALLKSEDNGQSVTQQ